MLPTSKSRWISILFLVIIIILCFGLYNYSYGIEKKVETMMNLQYTDFSTNSFG